MFSQSSLARFWPVGLFYSQLRVLPMRWNRTGAYLVQEAVRKADNAA
jgi:hypothetical protein